MNRFIVSASAIACFAGSIVAGCFVCNQTPEITSGSCGVGSYSACTFPTRDANYGEPGKDTLGPGTFQYGCTLWNISTPGDVINGPCSGSHPGCKLVGTDGTNCCWVKNSIVASWSAGGTTDQCSGNDCVGSGQS